jgi:hypothetical protein
VNSQFRLRQFTFSKYGNQKFTISTLWIHDFNFMNSRYHHHEFTIPTSWIHDFNFYEFNFVIWSYQIHEWRFNLQKFTSNFMKLKSCIHEIESSSWNREFMKINSGIY